MDGEFWQFMGHIKQDTSLDLLTHSSQALHDTELVEHDAELLAVAGRR